MAVASRSPWVLVAWACCLASLAAAGCATHAARAPARPGATVTAPPTTPSRPGASSVRAASAPAESPGFDVGAVVRRVRLAFRPVGDGWHAGNETYAVGADTAGFAITPRHVLVPAARPATQVVHSLASHGAEAPGATRVPRVIDGGPVRFSTRSVTRGVRALAGGVARGSVEGGRLSIQRGSRLRESVANTDDGVEQSWSFSTRPEGSGDLEVRVAVAGARFVGETDGGLHFADITTGLGVRYGRATWVDASGGRVEVAARWEGGAVVLQVPSTVVDAASYPATLDPLISPEFGMDTPVVGPASFYQNAPVIAAGSGDYLVVWSDWRGGTDADIFGTRVSSAGVVLDQAGIAISMAAGNQLAPAVAFDGTSWLVVWDDAGGVDDDIRGARVSAGGVVLDPASIAISTATRLQTAPAVSAGSGQWLVVWQDYRSGVTVSDVFGARVSSAGTLLDAAGIPVCTATADQTELSASYNGTDWLVVWQDYRVGAYMDIYGSRVSAAGVVREPGGIVIASATSWQQQPSVGFDGTNWFVVWLDSRNGPSEIYGARVNAAGVVLDAIGIRIATAIWFRGNPDVAFDGTNWLVVWQDDRNGVHLDILGARVSSAGVVLDPGSFVISGAPSAQQTPSVAFAGTSCLVVWADGRTGIETDIYGARVSAAGTVLDPPAGIPIGLSANRQDSPSAAFDGSRWLVVWQDYRNGHAPDIFGVRVDSAGVILDPSGIAISTATGSQEAPTVASSGSQWLVAWSDLRGGGTSDVYGARITTAGAVLDPTGIPISTATNHQQAPSVTHDGTNFLIVWEDLRWVSSLYGDVYGARVSAAGTVLDPSGIAICTLAGDQKTPTVVSSGSGSLVVWEDYRNIVTTGQDIYGARVSGAGTVIDPGGIAISTAPNTQMAPTLSFDGTNWLVAWQDLRGGNWDVYAARVSAAGVRLDPAGIGVSAGIGMQRAPSVGFDGTNHVVVYQDDRNGNADVYGARVSLAGTLVDAGGVALSASTQWHELAPRVTHGNGRDMLLIYHHFDTTLGSRRVFARTVTFGSDTGAACGTHSDCEGGFCVDGVCCNTACGGGAANDCQACSVAMGGTADGTCGPVSAGRSCRVSAGDCDVAESCDGVASLCPADGFAASTVTCRPSAGDCDLAEACSGTTAVCPVDAVAPVTAVCRPSAGACDSAESCNGTTAVCPPDLLAPATTECRPSAGACDPAESCSGSSAACPVDALADASVTCRASTGQCDVAESCTGSSVACPTDAYAPGTTECRAAAGPCDLAESCTGVSDSCPPDVFAANTTVCRPSTGTCDVADHCAGDSAQCPANASQPDGTACSDSLVCNGAEACTGGACLASSGPSCDDSDGCTTDLCEEPGGCRHQPVPGCCHSGSDCDDGDACTDDSCVSSVCTHSPVSACTADAGDDGSLDVALTDSSEDTASDAMPDAATDGGEEAGIDASSGDVADIVADAADDRGARDGGGEAGDALADAPGDAGRTDAGTTSTDGAGTDGGRTLAGGGCNCRIASAGPPRGRHSSIAALIAIATLVVSRRRHRR